MRSVLVVLVCLIAIGDAASADDGDPRFRRTTPRASLTNADRALVIGVPGGRAWGIESELLALPS